MDTRRIIADLKAELSRITRAIAAIEALSSGGNHVAPRGRVRRRMSVAARRRLSELAKQRWAARKGTAGKSIATPVYKGGRLGMSAAARKRISAAMKARWAEKKKARPV